MNNYIECDDKFAFHPGYYVKEIVDDSGLTQEDFAKRLGTTPKNLSILLRGEQSVSVDMAIKLSRMLGTSVGYWLNLQNSYDTLLAELKSKEQLVEERRIFKYFDYKYFRDNCGLPDLPRRVDEQIRQVRDFLNVSTLAILSQKDKVVSFRSSASYLTESNIVKANAMVQIATNKALKTKAPKFNKKKLEAAVERALALTENHEEFYSLVYKEFLEAGVIFVVLPNIPGSKTNGATKKVGDNIMLMVNDRRLNADTFWFTLCHEIGHIMNGDYGISFEGEMDEKEHAADKYAEDILIPRHEYQEFLNRKQFGADDIVEFAKRIGRDPGIVVGRLQNEDTIRFDDCEMRSLQHKYKIKDGRIYQKNALKKQEPSE